MIDAAIVGTGPYGLSLGAHLRQRGIPFRIFGRPMDSWKSRMPKGMLLKSDGFASNLCGADCQFTLRDFCAENHIEYEDFGLPVSLETFCSYGTAFQKRMVPELEDKLVTHIARSGQGFALELNDGETLLARRVVLAVGITHFAYVPPSLAQLPAELASHSSAHRDLEPFRGHSVAVIGAGASALDLAGLLRDAGAAVQLVARSRTLKFHSRGKFPRPLWERVRYPRSGLGPGLKSRFFSNWPMVFHYLPESYRLHAVRVHLGPSGGWFTKDKVIGRVPLLLGYTPKKAAVRNGQVLLELREHNGAEREILVDRVISATGYQVDMSRLTFIDESLRTKLKTAGGAPVLSSTFESSVPGLYFIGLSAANSFGPVMRFAYGARFAASRLTHAFTREALRGPSLAAVPDVATSLK
jgi:thioredoxin reductase